MRILNIIQCANLGGMEQASLRLMRALQVRGHDISLISLNTIGGLRPLLNEAGIPVTGLDYLTRGHVATFLDLRRAVAEARADALIMTGHNLIASLALGDACQGRRLLAIHFHHAGIMPLWRWRAIYRAACSKFQWVSFPSDYVRREAEAIYPAIRSRAVTIRNPLPLPEPPDSSLRSSFRQGIGVPADAPLIGNAGWLIRRKRFDVFLDVAAKVLSIRPDAWFVIAGDGEEKPALTERAVNLGISDRVIWTGWLTDMSAFFAGIDVLLFNSDFDAFPTTPIEAMAWGRPVIASVENGGLSEMLDGDCGWLLDRHDAQALASAIVLAFSGVGAERAAKARERVCAMANPARIAEQVEEKLEERCDAATRSN